MARPSNQLAEVRVPLTMPATMRTRLDGYCASLRRATGLPITRGEVIRDAILHLMGDDPHPAPSQPPHGADGPAQESVAGEGEAC